MNRNDFVTFLRQQVEDYQNNRGNWENQSVDAFLEAMASWIEDMDGYYINMNLPIPQDVDWNTFSDIIIGGKVYE